MYLENNSLNSIYLMSTLELSIQSDGPSEYRRNLQLQNKMNIMGVIETELNFQRCRYLIQQDKKQLSITLQCTNNSQIVCLSVLYITHKYAHGLLHYTSIRVVAGMVVGPTGLRSGDCGHHLNAVNSLLCSRNQFKMICDTERYPAGSSPTVAIK